LQPSRIAKPAKIDFNQFTEEKIRALKVGDEVLISGVVFTGHDAAGLASHPQ
jgi:tartrate dehydratase beta subunit/fumarate hydratase class I family protein